MSRHDQYAEDLALHALGVLAAEDRLALDHHLAGCADCVRELERLRGDLALLALATPGVAPPRGARERLLDAVEREPRKPARSSAGWSSWVPSFAAAALAVALALTWLRNGDLRRRLATLEHESALQQSDLLRANEVLATLTATDAWRVTLVTAKTPPQPQGRAIYVRNRGSLIFLASDFSPLPPEKAYELWLIPTTGSPVPVAVFKPDAHGSATVVNPPLPVGIEAKAFAITIEPEQGSPLPTSTPILMGARGQG
jgi:anti-sigma-K factor RskA